MCTGISPLSSLAQQGMARMRILVMAFGHYLQGEAWPERVERLVVEHDFAMFHRSFRFVLLCLAWLFGGCPWYHMRYTLVGFDPFIHWYRMMFTNKTDRGNVLTLAMSGSVLPA